jgi:hypothetical protein
MRYNQQREPSIGGCPRLRLPDRGTHGDPYTRRNQCRSRRRRRRPSRSSPDPRIVRLQVRPRAIASAPGSAANSTWLPDGGRAGRWARLVRSPFRRKRHRWCRRTGALRSSTDGSRPPVVAERSTAVPPWGDQLLPLACRSCADCFVVVFGGLSVAAMTWAVGCWAGRSRSLRFVGLAARCS